MRLLHGIAQIDVENNAAALAAAAGIHRSQDAKQALIKVPALSFLQWVCFLSYLLA